MSTVYCNGKGIRLQLEYLKDGSWIKKDAASEIREEGIRIQLALTAGDEDYMTYSLSAESEKPTQVRLSAALEEAEESFHVIPCCIYGDNNAAQVHAGEFPLLCEEKDTKEDAGKDGTKDVFRAARWEFRADRAAMPLSAVCTEEGVLAVTVEPYAAAEGIRTENPAAEGIRTENPAAEGIRTENPAAEGIRMENPAEEGIRTQGSAAEGIQPQSPAEEGRGRQTWDNESRNFLHNGLFAELPNRCGISLGYTNDPVSFINKRRPGASVRQLFCRASVTGRIYYEKAADLSTPRLALHQIIRKEYALRHKRPQYHKSFREAVEGCMNSLLTISWDPQTGEYTNCNCLPPANPRLRPWRNVKEIGWTGGGVLAYPLVLGEEILGDGLLKKTGARTGREMFDQIVGVYNEASGLLYDLTSPIDADTLEDAHNESSGLANVEVRAANERARHVNGWWSQFGLARNVHCAYTVGSALHYMLKTMDYLSSKGKTYPKQWIRSARQTMDTVIALQREDGAFGYTYSADRREVTDWNGFAGCWFVPCAAYLYHLTGEEGYLAAAEKGLAYYRQSVTSLTCSGTPMDTWKAPDEEGNLAFLRGARLLHEYTGKKQYLDALCEGAEYEFLWRYGYETRPENYPLLNGWNACGGSVTSVSNPHIHPMGMIVDSDLYYLGRVTGDSYYTDRALDGTAWLMQTLELYPKETGYGQYGVLSERWCPSDGLVIQKDSDGKDYSSWFSYNLWAGAAAFEEVCERYLGM